MTRVRAWLGEHHLLVWMVRLEWQPMLRRRWKGRFQVEKKGPL